MQLLLLEKPTPHYLSHVGDHNGHDDPVDGHSFTEDDTAKRKDSLSAATISKTTNLNVGLGKRGKKRKGWSLKWFY